MPEPFAGGGLDLERPFTGTEAGSGPTLRERSGIAAVRRRRVEGALIFRPAALPIRAGTPAPFGMRSVTAEQTIDRHDPRTVSPLGEQIMLMGEIAYLLSHSPAHLGYTIADLMKFFLVPIRLNQFRIYRTRDRPVGLAVWAYLSEDVAARYARGDYELRAEDWRAGREIWFVEFIAPFGHARRLIDEMREHSFADACAHYLRRREGAVRTLRIHGVNHPDAPRRPAARPEPVATGESGTF